MLHFYHISRDASKDKIESFKKGVDPLVGTGYGGQKGGFYCWTTEKRADKCFARWATRVDAEWAKLRYGLDITLKEGNCLKVGISVDESTVKYPKWQLDNEQHKDQDNGRERSILLDFWEAQKDLFTQDGNRFKIGDKQCAGTSFDEEKRCPVLFMLGEDQKEERIAVDITNAEESLRTQAINDYLCEKYPQYLENYNKLLQATAYNKSEVQIGHTILHPQDIALKYCGDEKITDIEKITLMHSNYGTDEKISNAKSFDLAIRGMGEYKVDYREDVLFSQEKANQISERFADIKNRVCKDHTTFQTIQNMRGIGTDKESAPVKKTTLDNATIKQATAQYEG